MKILTFAAAVVMLSSITLPTHAQKTKVKAKEASVKSMPTNNDANSNQGNMGTSATGTTASMSAMPYSPLYSSQAQMGDPANAKMVMNLYKDYETNNARWRDAFADTVTIVNPDGTIWKGKDQAIQGFAKERDAVTTFAFHPQAWMPVTFTDKNENWVLVWGSSSGTLKDGTQFTSDSHEIWRINKDGKIDLMEQFEKKMPNQ